MTRRAVLPALLALSLARPAVAAAADPGRTYVIMPFENVAEDASLQWLSTGLALSLGESLLGLKARLVDDEDRAVMLEAGGIAPGAPPTLATALEVGRKLRQRPVGPRPDRLVVGRFNLEDGTLTVMARSIDLAAEKARPWSSRQGRLKDLLELQNALALDLAHGDGLPIEGDRAEILQKQSGGLPLLAYETYCRAMAESEVKHRLQLLRRAVQEFPGYPKAAYQAAAILVRSERWEEAAEMLGRVAADPYPYEADFYLLKTAVYLQRSDATRAIASARRALTFADTARGHALLGRALALSGDAEGARQELTAAAALDPNEPENDDLRRALDPGARPVRRQP